MPVLQWQHVYYKESRALYGKIAIIDPAEKHYFQPLWTLVGGGVVDKKVTERI